MRLFSGTWYTKRMLLILNWKMNPQTLAEAKTIFEATKNAAARAKEVKAVVAPPAFFLHALAGSYKGRSLVFAAQNIHTETKGAFTGDVSARQAQTAGASYAIIGHAERRKIGETNEDVRKKVAMAFATELTPVICIGESMRDQSGDYLEFIRQQIVSALADVDKVVAKRAVVAYEPVWVVGADKPMEAQQMHEMTIFIRKVLWEKYEKAANAIPILYGGAILDYEHAVHIAKESEVDGFLLGRASIDTAKLAPLMNALNRL